jgi:hypothetical protein
MGKGTNLQAVVHWGLLLRAETVQAPPLIRLDATCGPDCDFVFDRNQRHVPLAGGM